MLNVLATIFFIALAVAFIGALIMNPLHSRCVKGHMEIHYQLMPTGNAVVLMPVNLFRCDKWEKQDNG